MRHYLWKDLWYQNRVILFERTERAIFAVLKKKCPLESRQWKTFTESSLVRWPELKLGHSAKWYFNLLVTCVWVAVRMFAFHIDAQMCPTWLCINFLITHYHSWHYMYSWEPNIWSNNSLMNDHNYKCRIFYGLDCIMRWLIHSFSESECWKKSKG